MLDSVFYRSIMFIAEYERENNSDYQSISRKSKPDAMPVFAVIRKQEKFVDDQAAGRRADEVAERGAMPAFFVEVAGFHTPCEALRRKTTPRLVGSSLPGQACWGKAADLQSPA